MRISDWSSDVCSSDLQYAADDGKHGGVGVAQVVDDTLVNPGRLHRLIQLRAGAVDHDRGQPDLLQEGQRRDQRIELVAQHRAADRSEEHTSELQSLMRSSYAVFCLKKKTLQHQNPKIYSKE